MNNMDYDAVQEATDDLTLRSLARSPPYLVGYEWRMETTQLCRLNQLLPSYNLLGDATRLFAKHTNNIVVQSLG